MYTEVQIATRTVSEPILSREQEMYNVDVLEFTSDKIFVALLRATMFLVAKGEIEGHFQTVSTIFASQIPR